jgi:hypothetical protein
VVNLPRDGGKERGDIECTLQPVDISIGPILVFQDIHPVENLQGGDMD